MAWTRLVHVFDVASPFMPQLHFCVVILTFLCVRLGDLSSSKHSKLSALSRQFAEAEDIAGARARVAEIRRSTSEGVNKSVLMKTVVEFTMLGCGFLS